MEIAIIITASVILILVLMIYDHRRMKKIAFDRGEADICKYARSFDYRKIDTKIMREVWSEVQACLAKYDGKPFPVKSSDLFKETYHLDADDLDDAYLAVANRLGINTENPEKNPYWNNVTSVKNLVLFLHNQPKLHTT